MSHLDYGRKVEPNERNRLAVGSTTAPNELLLFNLETGGYHVLEGHNATVSNIVWNAEGTKLYSAGYDNAVNVWDGATGALLAIMGRNQPIPDDWSDDEEDWHPDGHDDKIEKISLHASNTLMASTARDKTLYLWDLTQNRLDDVLLTPAEVQGLSG